FLDRGFVRLLVLLALGIGRRARLVPERNADGRPATRCAHGLAIGGARQQQNGGCGHNGSHALFSLESYGAGTRNLGLRSPACPLRGGNQSWHPRSDPANRSGTRREPISASRPRLAARKDEAANGGGYVKF